jgi:hypothetical protein
MNRLHFRNTAAGILHMINGVICVALYYTVDNFNSFTISISTVFLTWDDAGTPTQDLQTVWDFPFALWTSGFAFLSAGSHFAMLMYWEKYTSDLARGVNRFRWWEYALSSSLMIMLIAMLFGVWDLYSVILIGAINGAMNLYGDLFELLNANKAPANLDWYPFIYGCIAGLYPWLIIMSFLFSSPSVGDAPTFVWIILF